MSHAGTLPAILEKTPSLAVIAATLAPCVLILLTSNIEDVEPLYALISAGTLASMLYRRHATVCGCRTVLGSIGIADWSARYDCQA